MSRFFSKIWATSAFALFAAILFGGLFFSVPEKTYAACGKVGEIIEGITEEVEDEVTDTANSLTDVPVHDASNLVQNSMSAKYLKGLYDKECSGKKLQSDFWANVLVKTLLHNLTNSIVGWIENGFEGGPTFVTDPGQFLATNADQIAGQYIDGTALGFLCDPFKLNIQLALRFGYASREYRGCTLSQILGNINDFTRGDFSQGGWDGWAAMTTNSSNNPYGSLMNSEEQMLIEIQGRQNIEVMKLDWGRGFFSKTGEGGIRTPGSVIEAQVNNVLGSGQRQLEIADEIDEMIGAIGGALINQALRSAGGLLSN